MNPLSARKAAFVSSEDPVVIEALSKITTIRKTVTTHDAVWQWLYSEMPRENTGPILQLENSNNRTALTILWLSQLFLALECDHFAGTRNSNWNRLIDELRGVWVTSGQAVFLEIARERDWEHYHW